MLVKKTRNIFDTDKTNWLSCLGVTVLEEKLPLDCADDTEYNATWGVKGHILYSTVVSAHMT